MPIFHKKISNIPSTGDPSLVLPSDWNDTHVINGVLDLTSATSVFGVVATFNGVPTGTCNAAQLAVNTLNGNLFSCNNGTWVTAAVVSGSAVVFNNQVNTFTSAGTLDLTATTNSNGFIVPIGGGNLLPTLSGALAFNSTLGFYVAGVAGSTDIIPVTGGGTPGLCAQWTTAGQLGSITCAGSGTINAGLQFALPYYSSVGSANTLTAVNGPTSPNGVPQFFTETPSGGAATAPIFSLAGVTPRVVTTTSDTILITDRANYVTYNNGSAVGVVLPTAGSAGFSTSFVFGVKNLGVGAVTITPTTSQIDGASTKVLNQGDACTIYSDNTNYFTRCAPTQLVAGSNITFSRTATGLTITGSGGGAVSSVFGRTGAVVAVSGDYTLDQIGNPVANTAFTFPVGATTGLTLLGTNQPSSGPGAVGNQIFSFTAPNGGAATNATTTGGAGGGWKLQTGVGAASTNGAGNDAAGGIGTLYLGAAGPHVGGSGNNFGAWGRINVDANSNDNLLGGIGFGGTFPAGFNAPALTVRNINTTQGNTINNSSPALGMCSHMQENGVDTNVCGNMVLFPGFPTSNIMSIQNGNNPETSWLFEIPSVNPPGQPYVHYVFMQGGPTITTNNGGGSVGGDTWIWDPGGRVIIGMDPFGNRASSPVFFSTNAGTGSNDIYYSKRGTSGVTLGTGITTTVAGDSTNNRTDGTYMRVKMMTNASGSTIADGALLKMSATSDQITIMGTTDTGPGKFVGLNAGAGTTCGIGAVCNVGIVGVDNGVTITDNASTIGDVLIPSNATAGRVLSVTMPAPLPGSVVGISQKTVSAGAAVDISLQPSIGGHPYMSMLTGGYTNATTTASNITGLSFPVLANFTYAAECDLFYQGSASTAGLDITVTGPASPTSVIYAYTEAPTATSTQNSVATAFGSKLTGNATVTATTNLSARVVIGLVNGANSGTVQVQGSATGTGTVTVQNGSSCRAWAH